MVNLYKSMKQSCEISRNPTVLAWLSPSIPIRPTTRGSRKDPWDSTRRRSGSTGAVTSEVLTTWEEWNGLIQEWRVGFNHLEKYESQWEGLSH